MGAASQVVPPRVSLSPALVCQPHLKPSSSRQLIVSHRHVCFRKKTFPRIPEDVTWLGSSLPFG